MKDTVRNIFAIPDLRNRVLYTFGLLAVFRVGANIPIPGVNSQAILEFFNAQAGNFFGPFGGYGLLTYLIDSKTRVFVKLVFSTIKRRGNNV